MRQYKKRKKIEKVEEPVVRLASRKEKEKHTAVRSMSLPNGNEERFENGQRAAEYVRTYIRLTRRRRPTRVYCDRWLHMPDDGSRVTSPAITCKRGRGKFSASFGFRDKTTGLRYPSTIPCNDIDNNTGYAPKKRSVTNKRVSTGRVEASCWLHAHRSTDRFSREVM